MGDPCPVRHPGVSFGSIAAELRREGVARMNLYPALIAKGRLIEADAKRYLALIEAATEDCLRFAKAMAPMDAGQPMLNPLTLPAKHRFSWRERRDELLRELGQRDRLYPGWIKAGTLDQATADTRNHALEAMLELYELGFDWRPRNGVMPGFAHAKPTPEQAESRREWWEIENERADRMAPQEQTELGL